MRRAFPSLLVLGLLLGSGAGAHAALPAFAEEWNTIGAPEDVEVDPFGRVWVACDDDSVRVYAPRGGELLFAFGGTGTGDGEFLTPDGIAFDPGGDAYICDYAGARVEKFTSDGVFLLSWPIPSTNADHVAVDAAGDVYVTGYTDAGIHKFTSDGTPLLDWTTASVNSTGGILVSDGIVSAVLWTAPDVEQFDTDGNYLGSFPTGAVNGLDIEIDDLGQFWIVDFGGHAIRVFTAGGDPVDVYGTFGAGPGEFNFPSGIAFGAEGSVYVADQGNIRLQRFGDSVAGIDGPGREIRTAVLQSIAPNPTRAGVEVTFALSVAERVRLTVSDVTGRVVGTIEDGLMGTGLHHAVWDPRRFDGAPLAAGVYLVRLSANGRTDTQRLVVVR